MVHYELLRAITRLSESASDSLLIICNGGLNKEDLREEIATELIESKLVAYRGEEDRYVPTFFLYF